MGPFVRFLIVLVLTLSPGVIIITYVYLRDKHEKEPIGRIFRYFVYGIISLFITLVISLSVRDYFPNLYAPSFSHQITKAFLLVGFVEEFSKYVFVRFFGFRDKHFNEPFDGIVYTVCVSMGFATLENIRYVFDDGGLLVALNRMVTAVPAHASFAVIMGYFLGLARFDKKERKMTAFTGLFLATVFHGLYDLFFFIHWIPGIYLGAIVSLIIAILLSNQAMHFHEKGSPFNKKRPFRKLHLPDQANEI